MGCLTDWLMDTHCLRNRWKEPQGEIQILATEMGKVFNCRENDTRSLFTIQDIWFAHAVNLIAMRNG